MLTKYKAEKKPFSDTMVFQRICDAVPKSHAHTVKGSTRSACTTADMATSHEWLLKLFPRQRCHFSIVFFFLLCKLITKENMNCGEMGSFIAVQCLSLPHGHHIPFKGACALLLPLLPCHVRRMHQAKRYWRLPLPKQFIPARQRQSKAEWSSSMDFQGAELT